MRKKTIIDQIYINLGYEPTVDQENTIQKFLLFIADKNPNSAFLLNGYAGTGKTTLVGALVQTLDAIGGRSILLAPTGRAAKVFSHYAQKEAFTIHRHIYRAKDFSNLSSGFILALNRTPHTFFFVDEASMIDNGEVENFAFGSGRLLDDLIHYIYYNGINCRLVLIGDNAQLSPIKQEKSPALEKGYLEGYGLDIYSAKLETVVRQQEDSDILTNATFIRSLLVQRNIQLYPKLKVGNSKDVIKLAGTEFVEKLGQSYSLEGLEESMVITRSNKRATLFNYEIRKRLLGFDDMELTGGDRLMAIKNSYGAISWGVARKSDFIANGELFEVRRASNFIELYGFHFVDVIAYFPDYEMEREIKVLLDTLHYQTAGMSRKEQEQLFHLVEEDYAEYASKASRYAKIKADPYFSAVQVKYAYAITCHKAQGGQWNHVYLDVGFLSEDYMGETFYKWLYTAFTRAKEKLFLVNFPEEFFE